MKTGITKLENFNDFSTVFKVFEGFPFFENWSQEDIRQEYNTNSTNGQIFGYYENDSCVGFISMRPQRPNEHPVHYGHESRVMYISDLAVLPNYRNRGIATKLLEYAIQFAISENYQYIYTRLNDNNSMAYDIIKKKGFHKDYDFCEIVKHSHHGRNSEEFRIFMYKKL